MYSPITKAYKHPNEPVKPTDAEIKEFEALGKKMQNLAFETIGEFLEFAAKSTDFARHRELSLKVMIYKTFTNDLKMQSFLN